MTFTILQTVWVVLAAELQVMKLRAESPSPGLAYSGCNGRSEILPELPAVSTWEEFAVVQKCYTIRVISDVL